MPDRFTKAIRPLPSCGRKQPSEADAVLLYTFERVCDAIADGELRELGLSVEATIDLLRRLAREHVTGSR